MRPVVIQVPTYTKSPQTFADYAFAWAMENEYGPLHDFVKRVPTKIMREALAQLNLYLDGFGNTDLFIDDRFEDLTLYVDSYLAPEDADDYPLPSWLTYILDSYDI